jgi:hypothetical protein
MGFKDLPGDWSSRPLDTPGLAADVADLVVGDGDRAQGCVGLLLTSAELTMSQPCLVGEVDDAVRPEEFRPFLEQLSALVAEHGGGLVFVRGRPGSVLFTDTDRRWHQVAIDGCRAGGARLLGAFLATPGTVRSFPEPLAATGTDGG